MKRLIIVVIVASIVGIIFSVPLLSENNASAGTIKKIQFTQTITSSDDPGQGHGNEQLAMVLSPSNGTLYDGTLTYTASQPVQVIIFHKISRADSKGQPVWTVDNNTIYAETILNSGSGGGTLDFAGSALGIHSLNSSQFTATVSLDGWIRGATPVLFQNSTSLAPLSLRLSRAEVPVDIPLHEGIYGGNPVYYIVTDSSNTDSASKLSAWQDWKVQVDPVLAQSPQKLLSKVYVFTNGIPGNGTEGFQNNVFSDIPSNSSYTPISVIVHAKWGIGRTTQILNSTKDILAANATGKLRLTTTDTVVNMPQIVWPGGQMAMRDNPKLSDQNSYLGGQILGLDNATHRSVTFVAHKGWGPDGKTVYYVVTGGTPGAPAKMMGLDNIPALSLFSSTARDLYHFTNGISGGGPFGFQEGVSSSQLGDSSYSPICKVSTVTWKDGGNATVLENMGDINYEKSIGEITVQPALVYNNNYVIDCPMIEMP